MSRNTGSKMIALARRFSNAGLWGGPRTTLTGAAAAMSHPTEAPAPPLKIRDGAVEVAGAEIGPQDRGHPEFGVGDLPQEEVRDPHLATRTDEQIWVGHSIRIERPADVRLGDVLGAQLPRPHPPRQRSEGVEQLVAATVVEGHDQREAGIDPGLVDHVIDTAAHGQRHPVATAD